MSRQDRLELYDYDLPEELIAQSPAEPRDSSRLLVVPRDGPLQDRCFRDLVAYLTPRDVLVVNDSRVIPARLRGERPGGGKAELLLLRRLAPGCWECLGKPARRLRPGTELRFGDLAATVTEQREAGSLVVAFQASGDPDAAVLAHGALPLPPYIRSFHGDPARYQTVYARNDGSIAAPTAGLHFTSELLEELKRRGVRLASVTLHVGVGTFRPIATPDLSGHHMHSEWCELPRETVAEIERTRRLDGRVVAVGTTVVRTLEGAWQATGAGALRPYSGWTELFIRPGYRFGVVDALITNFHLPRSTLLVLVSAFAGRERIRQAYEHAIAHRYRFYSFGDAMLLL